MTISKHKSLLFLCAITVLLQPVLAVGAKPNGPGNINNNSDMNWFERHPRLSIGLGIGAICAGVGIGVSIFEYIRRKKLERAAECEACQMQYTVAEYVSNTRPKLEESAKSLGRIYGIHAFNSDVTKHVSLCRSEAIIKQMQAELPSFKDLVLSSIIIDTELSRLSKQVKREKPRTELAALRVQFDQDKHVRQFLLAVINTVQVYQDQKAEVTQRIGQIQISNRKELAYFLNTANPDWHYLKNDLLRSGYSSRYPYLEYADRLESDLYRLKNLQRITSENSDWYTQEQTEIKQLINCLSYFKDAVTKEPSYAADYRQRELDRREAELRAQAERQRQEAERLRREEQLARERARQQEAQLYYERQQQIIREEQARVQAQINRETADRLARDARERQQREDAAQNQRAQQQAQIDREVAERLARERAQQQTQQQAQINREAAERLARDTRERQQREDAAQRAREQLAQVDREAAERVTREREQQAARVQAQERERLRIEQAKQDAEKKRLREEQARQEAEKKNLQKEEERQRTERARIAEDNRIKALEKLRIQQEAEKKRLKEEEEQKHAERARIAEENRLKALEKFRKERDKGIGQPAGWQNSSDVATVHAG